MSRTFPSSTFLIGFTVLLNLGVLVMIGWAGGYLLGQKSNSNLIVFEKWLPFPNEKSGGKSHGKEIDIWMVRSDGTGLERLTSGFRDYDAAWSPDSSRIAFTRGRKLTDVRDRLGAPTQEEGLWILNVRDRTLRQLTQREYLANPQWLSNEALIYSAPTGSEEDARKRWRLFAYSFETESTLLMPIGGLSGVFAAKVSPNLKLMAFRAWDGTRDSLYLADARDIAKTHRILLEEALFPLGWTLDSKGIVTSQGNACFVVTTNGRISGLFAGIDA